MINIYQNNNQKTSGVTVSKSLNKLFLTIFSCFGGINAMEQESYITSETGFLLSRNEADFIYLASQNDLESVKRLSGLVDIDVRNKRGSTALHWASYAGYFDIVNYLLKNDATVDVRDNNRKTPLQWACGNGHDTIAKMLLEYGADPDLADEKGDTALHWSIFKFHNFCAKKLIAHKAEINCQNNQGISPLHTALVAGNLEMVNILLENGAEFLTDKSKRNPIHCAVWGKNLDCLKAILGALTDSQKAELINAGDREGETPLHYAAVNANWRMALELIKNGADVNKQCFKIEHTPLHIVLRNHKGTRSNFQSIGEYMDKSKDFILDNRKVITFIATLKMSGKLDTSITDHLGYTPFDYIEKMRFNSSDEKEALINMLFGKSRN